MTVNTTDWIAIVNLTPHAVHYNETRSVIMSPLIVSVTYNEGDRYTSTDLTISVVKGSLLTMQNTVVYQNVSPNAVYSIDLMDDAYGLKSVMPPRSISP